MLDLFVGGFLSIQEAISLKPDQKRSCSVSMLFSMPKYVVIKFLFQYKIIGSRCFS